MVKNLPGKVAFPRVDGRIVADNSEGGDRRHVRPSSRWQGKVERRRPPSPFRFRLLPSSSPHARE